MELLYFDLVGYFGESFGGTVLRQNLCTNNFPSATMLFEVSLYRKLNFIGKGMPILKLYIYLENICTMQ